jgi:hypothetical protein
VAERMAPLGVVYARLADAGLREFCLELHSTKANKRAVMREIGATPDLSLQRPTADESVGPHLQQVRAEWTRYTEAVHTASRTLGWTPCRAYGALELGRDAPRVRLCVDIGGLTSDQVLSRKEMLITQLLCFL